MMFVLLGDETLVIDRILLGLLRASCVIHVQHQCTGEAGIWNYRGCETGATLDNDNKFKKRVCERERTKIR